MKKILYVLLVMALLVLSVFAFGCSKDSNKISGKTTTSYQDEGLSSPDDPQIDKSYDVKRSDNPDPKTRDTKPSTVTRTTTTTVSEPALSGEERAEEIAEEYVKDLNGYKDFDGRRLVVTNIVQRDCDGCWIVDLTFRRDRPYYPDKEEIISVHVNLKDWDVSSYTFD